MWFINSKGHFMNLNQIQDYVKEMSPRTEVKIGRGQITIYAETGFDQLKELQKILPAGIKLKVKKFGWLNVLIQGFKIIKNL